MTGSRRTFIGKRQHDTLGWQHPRRCRTHRPVGWSLTIGLVIIVAGAEPNAGGVEQRSVDWLSEVQRPPVTALPQNLGVIAPLLIAADGSPIGDRLQWERHRETLRQEWRTLLGPAPTAPASPAARTGYEVLRTDELPKVTRQLVRYEGESGQFVEGYWLLPKAEHFPGRRPGIVALHSTSAQTIDLLATAASREAEVFGRGLAEQGFVVFCPRCFLWQEGATLAQAVDTVRQRLPRTLGMHKMLFDAQRAVDLLTAHPQVDAARLGAVGHSLGAKEVLYLTAFDERIRAAVASEGGLTLRSTNWDAAWYLGPACRAADFPRNHHELLALAAPRSLLILGGERGPGAADGDRSWPLIEAALPVYRLYDSVARLGLLNHGQGHTLPDEASRRAVEWLAVHLGRSSAR